MNFFRCFFLLYMIKRNFSFFMYKTNRFSLFINNVCGIHLLCIQHKR